MNRIKKVTAILCLSLVALAFSPGVKADDWNKETKVTFSQPIEIPGGIVLPAGTYIFKLMDSSSNRHIVQIFNHDRSHIYATILAIPNWRLRTTDKTVMTFGESVAGLPQTLRAWFYPGSNSGEEFVYPKRRALELAKVTNLPILAMPAELEAAITKPAKSANDEPVVALKEAPITAVKPTGEEVEIAEVVTPPPARTETARTRQEQPSAPAEPRERVQRLPQTASQLPLLGLIGLLSLGAGFALWFMPKRSA
jgi:hypothetical protein